MEQIEVHSRSYLLRWVHAKSGCTISWTIQPHKRSVNFGLFKHPGGLASLPIVAGLPALSTTTGRHEEGDVPEVVDKLASIGLKEVVKLGKCEADRFTQGRYDVSSGETGHYALVFDNTFSKSTSKNVTFFLLTYPTNCQTQIGFGAQVHHGQAMASAMSMAAPAGRNRSPQLGAIDKPSRDSLRPRNASTATLTSPVTTPRILLEEQSFHAGMLSKRRRKKGQGYARRYFSLDYNSSTLSYYHDRNSSALRGAIPLSLAAVGANAKTREISIDSGAEIWHLRAGSSASFESWKAALEKASQNVIENIGKTSPELDTSTDPLDNTNSAQYERLETLLSKMSGTRDAVRRLCQETTTQTIPSSRLPQSPMLDGAQSPVDRDEDNYFSSTAERPKFWKRKASGTESQRSMFKRSTSAQLAVPSAVPTHSNVWSRDVSQHERNINDNMRAILSNLDTIIAEFSALVKQVRRQSSVPRSAISRLSLHSIDSQEFFDAESGELSRASTQLLDIAADDEYEANKNDSVSDSDSDVDDAATTRGRRSASQSSTLLPKSKTLAPLPLNSAVRRSTIKAPTVMPPSLISFLRKNVGKDLSTISMPVSANEPTSLLQRAAENLEYSELLDKAATISSPQERLVYITAFVLSAFSSTRQKERSIRKPFNPMLGETFELVREDKNFRFVSEKVSHRPVQLAFHAEGANWSFSQSPKPSQKFWGKSSEIITEGRARIVLYPHTPGTFGAHEHTAEIYSFVSATCFLRNIIAGEKYVEPVGTMTVLNDTTGHRAIVTFKAGGMFSGRSEEVNVDIHEPDGTMSHAGLAGTWTEKLTSKDTGHEVWRVGDLVPQPAKHYGMTVFAATLNEVTSIEQGKLPPTDSRLRADQHALEEGRYDDAERLKNEIEEGQRARRKDMEQAGTAWTPRFFTEVKGADGAESTWRLKTSKEEGYWERRARGDWTGVVDVLSPI